MEQTYYQRNKEQAKARRKELYYLNKERDNQYSKEYYRKNKEQIQQRNGTDSAQRKRFTKHILDRYNMTLDQWNTLLIEQNGRCSICFNTMQNPHVDHCHDTGNIRGLLCSSCNRGLGYFGDNPETLKIALAYLRGLRTTNVLVEAHHRDSTRSVP